MSKGLSKEAQEGQLILLGEVGRPFGIKGEIRIHPYNPFSETFSHLKYLFLRSPQGETKKYLIQRVRAHQAEFLIQLEGISDRTQVEGLRGFKVLVEKSQLPKCREGEFYWFELIGLKVREEDGKEVGEVVRIEETNPELGGNQILVIKSECQEVMIPFARDAVKRVDLEKGEIIIRSLEDYKI